MPNDDEKHIDSSQVTSWSPCHVGRAIAIADSFPGVDVFTDEEHIALVGDGETNVYGSDVGGHLDLLAQRERRGRISVGSPDPTTVHHNTDGVASGCSDRCICQVCTREKNHRKAEPNCGCFTCAEYRRLRVKMNPIPW